MEHSNLRQNQPLSLGKALHLRMKTLHKLILGVKKLLTFQFNARSRSIMVVHTNIKEFKSEGLGIRQAFRHIQQLHIYETRMQQIRCTNKVTWVSSIVKVLDGLRQNHLFVITVYIEGYYNKTQ